MNGIVVVLLTWTAHLALWKVAFGCPKIENIECSCGENESTVRICYDTVTRDKIFEAEYSGGSISLYCRNGESLDVYFNTSLQKAISDVKLEGCTFNETWLRHIISSPIRNLEIIRAWDLNFNITSLFLERLPLLNDLRLSNLSVGYLPSDIFKANSHLQVLFLRNSGLTVLHAQPFDHVQNLSWLSLQDNYLKHLLNGVFNGLYVLEILDLSRNVLTCLDDAVFHDLRSLTDLNIQDNLLESLPEDLLLQNPKLKIFELQGNRLKWLSANLLRNVKNLRTLDVSNNPLVELPNEFLKDLANLKFFYGSACNFTSVPSGAFQGALNLTFISFKQNRLERIERILFSRIRFLTELDLSENDISDLIDSPFTFAKKLVGLNLRDNKLNGLPSKSFAGLMSLEWLDISQNLLISIEDGVFRDIPLLKMLNISNNALSVIPEMEPHFFPSDLVTLDINDNKLKNMFFFYSLKKLKELRLKRNRITSLAVFLPTEEMETTLNVYLQENSIKTVNVDPLKLDNGVQYYHSRLKQLNAVTLRIFLQNNPLVCDCYISEFFAYIKGLYFWFRFVDFVGPSYLRCEEPPYLKGEKILDLEENDFNCVFNRDYSEECSYSRRVDDKAIVLDCRGLTLRRLPEIVPHYLKILHIENNALTELGGLDKEQWDSLSEIYADNNHISSTSSADWYIPPNVLKLSLRHNQLSVLPESIKRHAGSVKSFQMSLSNNPWACDCSFIQFKVWLSKHSAQVEDLKEIFCPNDVGERVMPLMEMPDIVLCPLDFTFQNKRLILYVTSTVVVATAAMVSLILYYRNEQTVRAYIYVHLQCLFSCLYEQEDLDKDKLYDAFISYSSEDRDVTFEIIKQLESKDPFYKLCIHERDWVAGNFIMDNILMSVQSSRKTILILSQHFLNSAWFDIEFHAAYYQMLHDKMDRIILVLKGDLPAKESMNKNLKHLMNSKTYLIWGEKWFWEKMRYSMPSRKRIKVSFVV